MTTDPVIEALEMLSGFMYRIEHRNDIEKIIELAKAQGRVMAELTNLYVDKNYQLFPEQWQEIHQALRDYKRIREEIK